MSDESSKRPCDEAVASLYAFIDREMDEVAAAVVRAHLEDCSPCFEAFEFEAEIKAMISQRCREELPDHLFRRVQESLRVEVRITTESPRSSEE